MTPMTVRSGTPSNRSTVAAVCRASCSRPYRTPAVFIADRICRPSGSVPHRHQTPSRRARPGGPGRTVRGPRAGPSTAGPGFGERRSHASNGAATTTRRRSTPASSDAEDACIKVDVGPMQAEHFTLSETERQRDGSPRGVPPLDGRLEDEPHLLDRVRLDLLLLYSWRSGPFGDVLRRLAPARRRSAVPSSRGRSSLDRVNGPDRDRHG